MRTRFEIQKTIIESGVVAIVRLEDSSQLSKVADAITAGGINVIEFTMTTPGALEIIKESTKTIGDKVLLGAGTVLDPETARLAILAGAEFIVSPLLNRGVVEMCHRYNKVCLPGAYTPTEIMTAIEWGADFVKLFPANTLGPSYIKSVRAPLPQAQIVPTGGVSLANCGEFIKAGAVALAVGADLVNSAMVAKGEFDKITEIAAAFRAEVQKARGK